MKTKRFSVTATGAWAWAGPVNVVYYEAGVDAGGQTAMIRLRSPDGNVLDAELKPGRQISLPNPVDGVVIESLTGNSITGKVSLGLGDIKDSSLLGTVEVVDGGKARSLAGSTFTGLAYQAGVAGNYPNCQLWNPGASGKNVIVSQVLIQCTVSGMFGSLRIMNAALANAYATPNAPAKRTGGGMSAAQLRIEANVGGTGTTANNIGAIAVNQYQTSFYRLTEPIVLTPGYGLTLVGSIAASDLAGTFEFSEEAQ